MEGAEWGFSQSLIAFAQLQRNWLRADFDNRGPANRRE